MTTNVNFPKPKDPDDAAYYTIWFPEPVMTIVSSSVATSAPADTNGLGAWTTPGDAVTGTILTMTNVQLTPEKMGVTFLLQHGLPGATYAVRCNVITASGAQLSRSAILNVTGL